MQNTIEHQVERVTGAEYPRTFLASVAWSLLRKTKHDGHVPETASRTKRFAFVPYLHGIRHNLKKVGTRLGVEVMFITPQKHTCLVNTSGNLQKECTEENVRNT